MNIFFTPLTSWSLNLFHRPIISTYAVLILSSNAVQAWQILSYLWFLDLLVVLNCIPVTDKLVCGMLVTTSLDCIMICIGLELQDFLFFCHV